MKPKYLDRPADVEGYWNTCLVCNGRTIRVMTNLAICETRDEEHDSAWTQIKQFRLWELSQPHRVESAGD
jgi:hypothetical protein